MIRRVVLAASTVFATGFLPTSAVQASTFCDVQYLTASQQCQSGDTACGESATANYYICLAREEQTQS